MRWGTLPHPWAESQDSDRPVAKVMLQGPSYTVNICCFGNLFERLFYRHLGKHGLLLIRKKGSNLFLDNIIGSVFIIPFYPLKLDDYTFSCITAMRGELSFAPVELVGYTMLVEARLCEGIVMKVTE